MSYPPPGPPVPPAGPPPGQWSQQPPPPYAPGPHGQGPYGQRPYGQGPYGAGPYAAPPQPDPRRQVHPHPEPRSYPQMLRTWDYAWWKPVVGFLTLLVGGFIVVPLVLLPVLAIGVAIEGGPGSYGSRFAESASLDVVTPSAMLYLNLTLASLTLVAMGIVRVVHRLRPRWLSSVLPGIRWKFLFACFGLSIVALIVSLLTSQLLPQDPNELGGGVNEMTGRLVATGIVILLTTPLQALGEEYAFRGYLMQAMGSLVGGIADALGVSRKTANMLASAGALVITSGLFALAHGVQNFPLFFDRFAFGVMAGLTVILIGGLEAGIALHVFNNLLAFGIAIFFGDLQSALTVSEVSWWQLPVTIVQNGVYLLLVLWVARRMGLRSTTSPPAPGPAPEPVGGAA